MCQHLRQKLEHGNDPLKEEMILCLMELVKDYSDETIGTSEEWTMLVDRGGLWHVKETTYALFLSSPVYNLLYQNPMQHIKINLLTRYAVVNFKCRL